MLAIADADIGGARVRRTFTRKGAQMRAGDRLTGDEVRAIPLANRRALADSGYIEVWPSPAATPDAPRHIVNDGFGKFSVIAGVKLNDRPLSKDEAEELATRPS